VDKNYLLDTSALFVYIESEQGHEAVDSLLTEARRGRCAVFVSLLSLMELYYISWQKKGEDVAKELIVLVKALPVEFIQPNERIILFAGRLKALHHISAADAIIAATAADKSAVLVHKDPEFEQLGKHLQAIKLPYKRV
jgi:predicted nucleic acid-binding protein